jgi:DNA repair exonuclease SbcCD ATPase subunit
MDINITNFRGINSWQGHINNGLTLLKGESGRGKSTILEAIKWCLYGQMRQVFPFSGKKDTEVSISINDIIITRKKNPELIKWSCKDIVLEASAAEKQIEKYFGSKLLWQAGSYIQQGEKIVLLAGSNSEKSALIKEIVFSGQEEKSEELIHKFRDKINSLEKEVHSFLYMMENIKNKKEEYNQDNSSILDKIKPNFYESKLYKSKDLLLDKLEEIKTSIKDNQEQIIINKLLAEKNKLLAESQEQIKKYPPELDQKKFLDWQNYNSYKENLKEINIREDIIIEENLDQLLQLNVIHITNKNILSEYNLEEKDLYNELEIINKKIIEYYNYEKYSEKLKIYSDYQNNIKKYQDYFDNLIKLEENILKNWHYINTQLDLNLDLNDDNLISLEYKLKHCKEGFLTCPNCNKKLLLKDNKLIEKNINIEEKILAKLEKILANIKLYLKNKKECQDKINTLSENEIEKPEEKIDPEIDDIDYYKNKQIKLSQYQKIEGVNISEKISILKNRERVKEIENYIKKIYQSFFDNYIIDEENYFSNFISLKNNIIESKKYINNHENKEILDLEKEEKLIVRIEEKLATIKEQENIYAIKDNITKYEEQYQKEAEKYNQANKEIKICQKLIKLIQHSENESFTHFINYFNILTNEILTILFENCYLKIKAFKENDKTKTIKAQLDFNIFIDGNKYDNWHILSGGEKDRISIAMTLAFNYLKTNKLLLLDECMASLDVDNRAKCLKAIKKYAKDKIVINICHETIEGFYDEIIDY